MRDLSPVLGGGVSAVQELCKVSLIPPGITLYSMIERHAVTILVNSISAAHGVYAYIKAVKQIGVDTVNYGRFSTLWQKDRAPLCLSTMQLRVS